MRIKDGFELRKICGENIIIAHGVGNIDFTKIISLNESAADVWNAVANHEFTIEDMAGVLLENYEVDEDTALQDSKNLLSQWQEVGFIEE